MPSRRFFLAALAATAASPALAQFSTGQQNPFAFGGNGRVQPPPPTPQPQRPYGPPPGYGLYGAGPGYGRRRDWDDRRRFDGDRGYGDGYGRDRRRYDDDLPPGRRYRRYD